MENQKNIYFLKRWTQLTVKILRITTVLKEVKNTNTHIYLKDYAKELERIKNEEKQQFYERLPSNS